MELYCKKCERLICLKCAIKGGKHHSHDYKDLEQTIKKYKEEMTASLGPMEQQLTTVKKALAQFERCCGEISDQRAAIEADVHKRFRQLREMLDVRETEVIGQLHQLSRSKLKSLACSAEGPDRDPPGQARQLYRLHEGEP